MLVHFKNDSVAFLRPLAVTLNILIDYFRQKHASLDLYKLLYGKVEQ